MKIENKMKEFVMSYIFKAVLFTDECCATLNEPGGDDIKAEMVGSLQVPDLKLIGNLWSTLKVYIGRAAIHQQR